MVLIERHLVDMTKYAPVYEMTDEACESGDPITLNLIESHFNVLFCNLFCSIMERLTEMFWSTLNASLAF